MKLPNGKKAVIGKKLEQYVLNSNHREGKHKARVFTVRLGISWKNKEVLENSLMNAAQDMDTAEMVSETPFGALYVLNFPLATLVGTATVKSVWIILKEESFPRLVTCYII